MALVLGTNCGFVTEAPTEDPEGDTETSISNKAAAYKVVAPANITKVNEIGWYCTDATDAANTQVGIYSHDSGNNRPNTLLGTSGDFAKGTDAGWKHAVVDIELEEGVTYWLAFQCDDSTGCNLQLDNFFAGKDTDTKDTQTELPASWGTTDDAYNHHLGVYAVYETEAPPEGTGLFVNVDDVLRSVDEIHVNKDDVWRSAEAYVNKDDVWRAK